MNACARVDISTSCGQIVALCVVTAAFGSNGVTGESFTGMASQVDLTVADISETCPVASTVFAFRGRRIDWLAESGPSRSRLRLVAGPFPIGSE